jgi:hypothetical protein
MICGWHTRSIVGSWQCENVPLLSGRRREIFGSINFLCKKIGDLSQYTGRASKRSRQKGPSSQSNE